MNRLNWLFGAVIILAILFLIQVGIISKMNETGKIILMALKKGLGRE